MHLSSPLRRAVTLLEVGVSIAILGTVMAMVTQSINMGSSMHETVSASSDLTNRADRLVKQIAYQLRSADYNWITISTGTVSTYQFTLCTGVNVNGPVFTQGYTLTYDSAAGTLSATLTDLATGAVLQKEVASGLRKPNTAAGIEAGFQIIQLGQNVVVTGNQLQLRVALEDTLRSGEVVERDATSVVFLRSTMYANANLTQTNTVLNSSPTSPTTPTTTTPTTPTTTTPTTPTTPTPTSSETPVILIGSDTDTTTTKGANNLIILSQISMPSGTTDTVDFATFTITTDKLPTDNPQKTDYTITKGWESGSIGTDKFQLTGWVKGSLTITVTVQSKSGKTATATKTF